jgi:DNA-binding beta-propeller fold protein YncE
MPHLHTFLIGQTQRARVGTGRLSELEPAAVATESEPFRLVVSPDGKHVYVTNRNSKTISQFSRNAHTGRLTLLGTIATGTKPYYIAISPDGKNVYVTNRSDNTVSQYTRNAETGALSALAPATVATGEAPEGIIVSPNGQFVYLVNYTSKTITEYTRNAETGKLTHIRDLAIAAHPRQLAISPDGKNVYVITESVEIYRYSINEEDELELLGTTAMTFAPVDIAVSPDGKNVYVPGLECRKLNQYARNSITGELTALEPATVTIGDVTHNEAESLVISPDGADVYVTIGPKILEGVVYEMARDSATGKLEAFKPANIATQNKSVGIAISPDGRNVYVANRNSDSISQYHRDIETEHSHTEALSQGQGVVVTATKGLARRLTVDQAQTVTVTGPKAGNFELSQGQSAVVFTLSGEVDLLPMVV